MAAPVFPTGSSTFLDQFGTPTLLWRVLSSVGYPEAPSYTLEVGGTIGRCTMVRRDLHRAAKPHKTIVAWVEH